MLRMHFTGDDLAGLRVAAGPDPMWETVLSVHVLSGTYGRLVFEGWCRAARRRLRALPRQRASLIRCLMPSVGDFPDFLTPFQETPGSTKASHRSRARRAAGSATTCPCWRTGPPG